MVASSMLDVHNFKKILEVNVVNTKLFSLEVERAPLFSNESDLNEQHVATYLPTKIMQVMWR